MSDPFGMLADLIDPPSDQLAEEATALGKDLRTFVRAAWPVLEPSTPYLHNWHIDLLCEYLEAFYAGEVRRLIVNMPPRYMKSGLCTILGPVWDWTHRPHHRFLFASYAQPLSTKHSIDRRTLIRSLWFQERFGHMFRLAGDQDVKTKYANDKRGHMIATSFGGIGTGEGGDYVVIDDPQDPKRAASDTQRETINTRFDQTFSTRLDDKKRGGILVVMQRLHARDLTGHLLEKEGDSWEHVKLPAEVKRSTVVEFPRSDRKVTREPGQPLWPEREDSAELEQAAIDLGSYGYAGQYDQDPSPAEGGIFRRTWWGFWKPAGLDLQAPQLVLPDDTVFKYRLIELPVLEMKLQSWDCTFKDTKDSDYVVGQVWGAAGARRFLIDQIRDRMSFTRTISEVKQMSSEHPDAYTKIIEDKANGPAVIDTLKDSVPGVIAVNPEGGKDARAQAVSPQVEAGQVYLPHPAIAPWVWDYIEEHATFPNAANDDQVDGTSQALLRMMHHAQAAVQTPAGVRQ